MKILHDKDQKQFFAVVEGKKSFLDYSISADGRTLDYYSTFVPPELRGRHIGQDIVKFALDYAKENNYKIIPSCPFVEKYIENHPEYKSIKA